MLTHLWTLWDSEDTLLAAPEGVFLSELPGGQSSLLIGSRGDEAFGRLTLNADGTLLSADWTEAAAARGLTDLHEVEGLGLLAIGRDSWRVDADQLVGDIGIGGRLSAITATIGGDWIVSAEIGQSGLRIHHWDGPSLEQHDRITDTGMLPLGDVNALASMKTDSKSLIFATSAMDMDGGIASYHITETGEARLRDIETPGGEFAAWLPNVLVTAQVGTQDFIIVGASGSGTISVFEVRDKGGLIHRHTLADDRDTRFDGIDVLEQATLNGRTVLLAAGSDQGLTVLEINHAGELSLLDVIWDDHDTALSDPSAISILTGDVLQIAVTDRVEGAVSLYTLDLNPVHARVIGDRDAETLVGTAQNDVLDGRGGRDVLSGLAGDDFLTDGRARDILTGGEGADIFIFHADGATDQITDFEDGIDLIDLRAYGLTGIDALDIRPDRDGANIFIRDEKLIVESATGTKLKQGMWDEDDFLF